jgi:hypothetical protein
MWVSNVTGVIKGPCYLKPSKMHKITGFFFFDHKDGRRFVIYSTLYESGRYANTFECTGLTDEQARGKFVIDHSNMVELTLKQQRKSKLILS